MEDVRIHRLSLPAATLIVYRMKNHLSHYPTVAELRALEIAAHRERSLEVARLIHTGAHALKSLFARLVAASAGKETSHA